MDRIIEFFKSMQKFGVKLLFVYDPKSKNPSVSLTLLCMSSTIVILGILTKWSKLIGGVNMDDAFRLLETTAYLYFGRTASELVAKVVSKKDKEKSDAEPKE